MPLPWRWIPQQGFCLQEAGAGFRGLLEAADGGQRVLLIPYLFAFFSHLPQAWVWLQKAMTTGVEIQS